MGVVLLSILSFASVMRLPESVLSGVYNYEYYCHDLSCCRTEGMSRIISIMIMAAPKTEEKQHDRRNGE